MKRFLPLFCLTLILFSFNSDKQAFLLYDSKAKQLAYDKMLAAILKEKPDVVLFGEQHNNPICHWLELELSTDIYAALKDKLVLGAEMFESDNQVILNEYLAGKVNEKTFSTEAKVWPNYKTDYKPLLDLAKDNHLQFIATNIPTRYSRMVYNTGFAVLDSIDPDSKKWIAPLPVRYNEYLKCYQNIFKAAEGHGSPNLPKSQAIKDATMASFILKNHSKGQLFLHFNGAYHSNNSEGIVWYLKQAQPDLKIIVISSVEQENITKLEKESVGIANYVICIPSTMSKTY